MSKPRTVTLRINGKDREVVVPPQATLLETLRDLGHVEVKSGCKKGDCGACAVLLDGEAVDSCLELAWTAEGKSITTVSGLGSPGAPHPLQQAFIVRGAVQCGYCTPGLLVAAVSMLHNDTAQPDEDDVRLALGGNLCRCTGYTRVIEAVLEAARSMRGKGEPA